MQLVPVFRVRVRDRAIGGFSEERLGTCEFVKIQKHGVLEALKFQMSEKRS